MEDVTKVYGNIRQIANRTMTYVQHIDSLVKFHDMPKATEANVKKAKRAFLRAYDYLCLALPDFEVCEDE